MGKRGFVGAPIAIVKQKGYYRPSRHGEVKNIELNYLNYVPEPPEGLNEDGKEFWTGLLSELIRIENLVSFHSLGTFEQMAYNYQVIRQCQPKLNEGLTEINPTNGMSVISPYWKIYNDAFRNYIALSREFGCTPSAMDRLNLSKGKESEDFTEVAL